MEIDKTSSSSQQFTITNRYSMPGLQLRQPQPQNHETSIPGIKLGYVLVICVHETWIKFPIKFIWISIYTTIFTPNPYWNRYNWTLQQIATAITAGRSWMIYPWSFHQFVIQYGHVQHEGNSCFSHLCLIVTWSITFGMQCSSNSYICDKFSSQTSYICKFTNNDNAPYEPCIVLAVFNVCCVK